MKLGTKTRYSARAMVDLALNYEDGNGVTTVKEISARQQVSPKYLEHLLASLRSAGLVRSVRGAQGGHTLTRPPNEVTLRERVHPICVGIVGGRSSRASRSVYFKLYLAGVGVRPARALQTWDALS